MNKFFKLFYSRKLAITLLIIISALAFLETMFLRHLCLKSIYTRWWFVLIWIALFLNLILCNQLRIRKLWRRYKRQSPINLNYKGSQHILRLSDCSQEYLEQFGSLLKEKGYKLQESSNEVIGYKGRWAEVWSIIFHLSFLIILLGVIYHHFTFTQGSLVLTEGQKLADVKENYIYYSKGKLGTEEHDYSLQLLDLNPKYYENGKLKELKGRLKLESFEETREETIKVNYPIYYKGQKILLQDYDFSPQIVLLDEEGNIELYSYVALDLISGHKLLKQTFKIPETDLVLRIGFFPDYQAENGREMSKSLKINNPRFDISIHRNSKLLDHKQVGLKEPIDFKGGSILIRDVKHWGEFNISSQRGIDIIFFGFWLGIIGLACRIFIRYKRIGIKLSKDKLIIKGQVDMNSAFFKRELSKIVEEFKKEEDLECMK